MEGRELSLQIRVGKSLPGKEKGKCKSPEMSKGPGVGAPFTIPYLALYFIQRRLVLFIQISKTRSEQPKTTVM